jgi:plastocyanin
MARASLALAAALSVSAVAAGCAGTHIVGAHRTVFVALTEYRLSPQSVQARAGRLTIYVKNDGRLTHNLAVLRGSRASGSTQPIAPGHHARLTLVLRSGTYVVASTMLSDQALGLYGTLVVK